MMTSSVLVNLTHKVDKYLYVVTGRLLLSLLRVEYFGTNIAGDIEEGVAFLCKFNLSLVDFIACAST